jgi:hypothetical protein
VPSIKASFDGFQKFALASGDKATPASPIPPDRESGVINKNGTAVGIAVELVPFVFVVPPLLIICANDKDGSKNKIQNKVFLVFK